MRTLWIRRLIGIAALSVAVVVVAADSSAQGPVPAATAEKAIAADIAHLNSLYELSKSKKKLEGRMKGTAMLIARYAQDNMSGPDADKMAALRAHALKVAEAIAKKDVAGAEKLTAGLADPKANGSADKKPLKLAGMHKLELHELMDLFGGSIGGGMNIEKDIREAKKNGPKDAASAALIAARTAAIADYALDLPPEFGGKKTKEDWERWNKEMKKYASDIAAEAGKPKADLAKVKKLMSSLDANCTNCHNVFRDE